MQRLFNYLHKDFLLALFVRGAGVILTFLLNILLARIYGPDLSGYYYIFYNFLALIHSIVFMGFGYVIVHHVTPFLVDKIYIKKGNTLLSLSVYILLFNGILMTVLISIFSMPLSQYLCQEDTFFEAVIITAFCTVPYTAVMFFSELLKAMRRPNWSIACANIVVNIIFIILLLVSNTANIEWIMKLYFITNLISLFVILGLCFRSFKEEQIAVYSLAKTYRNFKEDFVGYKAFLEENWVLTAVSVSNVILNVFDTIVIGNMLTTADVALYNVANKVVSFGSIVLTTVNTLIGYQIAELSHRGDKDGLRKILKKYTKLMIPLGIAYYVFAILFATLIPWIFGSSYRESIPLAVLLAIGQLITIITGPCSYFMIMTGQTIQYRKIVVATAVLTIILNIVLVPMIGIWGAVLSNVLTLAFKNIVTFVFAAKSVKLSFGELLRMRK